MDGVRRGAGSHRVAVHATSRCGGPGSSSRPPVRHSYATDLLRRGVAVEVVQHLLGRASISTTVDTYSHLGIEDARRALVAAGVLDEGGAS